MKRGVTIYICIASEQFIIQLTSLSISKSMILNINPLFLRLKSAWTKLNNSENDRFHVMLKILNRKSKCIKI